MRRVAFVLLTITLFSYYAIAQSDCPSISVTGPAGIVEAGHTGTYSVNISPLAGGQLKLEYLWSTSVGTIVRGQGTKAIEVSQPNGVTVTVTVTGLPQGCPNIASETASWDPAPDAVKIDVIRSFETGRYENEVAAFAKELEENPDNQGFIFFDHNTKVTKTDMAQKEKIVIDAVSRLWEGFDRSHGRTS